MRIIFMGTPDFAVPSLRVAAQEHEVLAVVTQPDRPRGRGQKVSYSPVKSWALDQGLTVLQPERIGASQVMDELESYGADLFVVVAFGQKIPTRLLEMPKFGCINVHSSLLPKYRGAAPINAAIVNGESVTGVTTMYLSEEWDAGDLILQAEEPIYPEDTAGTLHDRLMEKGALLLGQTLRLIEVGEAPRVPQNHDEATFAFKLAKEDAYVDFSRPASELANLIRGMNPWPGAHTDILGESVKIWKARPVEQTGSPGCILSLLPGQGLVVGCGEGALLLEELQRPNSKAVSGQDFANGLRLAVGDYLQR